MCVFKSGSVYCSVLVVCSLLQTFVQQTINQIIIVYSNFSLTAAVYFSGGLHKIKFHFFSLGFKASQAVLLSSSLKKQSFLIFIFDLKQGGFASVSERRAQMTAMVLDTCLQP